MVHIYCDLDGVLADFDKGVKKVTGQFPHQFKHDISVMWRLLANSDDFYYKLNFMPDAKVLWNHINKYNPTILTGLPRGKWAHGQKVRWVGENLGCNTEVITCMSAEKYMYCQPGDVLIDDRASLKPAWEKHGKGKFILHTSAQESIDQLEDYLSSI